LPERVACSTQQSTFLHQQLTPLSEGNWEVMQLQFQIMISTAVLTNELSSLSTVSTLSFLFFSFLFFSFLFFSFSVVSKLKSKRLLISDNRDHYKK
jgi:hypothetical protein